MNALVQRQPAPVTMVAAVLQRMPQINTARMISSLQQCGCELVVKRRMTFPVDSQTRQKRGWHLQICGVSVDLATEADLQRAKSILEASMAPADEADLYRWLAELSLLTVTRAHAGASAELMITAYTKRLLTYPGDIARQVLETWSGKWFPVWADLNDALGRLLAERRTIVDAVSTKLALRRSLQGESGDSGR